MFRKLLLPLALILLALPTVAQTNPTGQWTGTYSSSITLAACQNKTFTSTGNLTVTFLQTGSSLLGRMTLTNVLVFNNSCTPTHQDGTRIIIGSVSGNTLIWGYPNDSGGTQYSATITGTSIAGQLASSFGSTGTFNLSRITGAAPNISFTGSWSGNYSFNDICPNGASKAYTGTLTLGLTQTGSNAVGVMTMQNVPLYDQNCSTITPLTMTMATAGTITGSTFTGSVFDPTGSFDFPITATTTNGAIAGSASGTSLTTTTGTFNLTQSSSAAPASNLGGTYAGTYREVDNYSFYCANIGGLAFDGASSIAAVQAGDAISAALVFDDALNVTSDGFGLCAIYNAGEVTLPLYGTMTNNTVTLTLPLGGTAIERYTATFGDQAVSGTIVDSFGDQASFTTTRTAAATPPVVNSFTGSSQSIIAGQSTTLTWATANATSVSIDNGVGSQPLSGTITISPSQTTTYTLTAMSPTGTATATVTINVYPPGPRRRSAHQ